MSKICVSKKQVHVYIVAEHPLAARELARILRKDPSLKPTTLDDWPSHPALSPPILVLDSASCGDSFESVLRKLNAKYSDARIVAILDEKMYYRRDPEQLGMHAWIGYKEMDLRLAPAIHAAVSGLCCRPVLPLSSPPEWERKLTARERQTCDLLRLRHSNREIAQNMRLQPSTVKSNVRSVIRKAGVSCRRDLVLDRYS